MSFPDCPDFSYAAAGGARKEQIKKQRKIGVRLILFGRSSLCVLYGYFTKGVRKNRMAHLALHFWRLSLGVLYAPEKSVYTRE